MKRLIAPVLVLILLFTAACSFVKYADSDTLVVTGKQALKLVDQGYLLLDAQKATSYGKEHVKGAANIERAAITISDPVPNTVAPASQVAAAAGAAGLTETSDVVIYDDNNDMDSSRLYWTLKYYGHRGDVKIVSGGLQSLASAKGNIVEGTENIAAATYKTSSPDPSILATTAEVEKALGSDGVIIDVRSDDEYYAGTIPGSIHINYESNNLAAGGLRPAQHIKILYKEKGILPDDEIIMFCKTSIRAANTYAALYNAGYRNLKIYDGAWLEWSGLEKKTEIPQRDLPAVSLQATDNS